jgi:hypothetical protein
MEIPAKQHRDPFRENKIKQIYFQVMGGGVKKRSLLCDAAEECQSINLSDFLRGLW